jgi:PKD repeat protein
VAKPGHSFAAPGTYPYSLTVTDDQGLSSAPVGGSVTVTNPSTSVGFRAASQAYVKSATVASGAAVTAPSAVRAGDTELLFVSSAAEGATGTPAGWSLLGQQSSSPLQVRVFERTAVAADAGAKVSVPVLAASGIGLQLADYSGAGPAVTVVGASDSGTASHATPPSTVSRAGSWVLSYWADRSSTTTGWTLPVGVSARNTVIGTGGGHPSAAIADSGQPVAPGPSPARTATVTGGASGKGAMLTLVLPPQSS